MSMTISMVSSSHSHRIPQFQSLRRLLARFTRMEQQDPSQAQTTETAKLSKTLERCVDLLNEWLPELMRSLESMDLEQALESLRQVDQAVMEHGTDDDQLVVLCQEREQLSQTVCASLRIAAGTLRTAMEELEIELGALLALGGNGVSNRYEYLSADLRQVADQWGGFSDRMVSFESPSMTAHAVRELLSEQTEYLSRLHQAHQHATR